MNTTENPLDYSVIILALETLLEQVIDAEDKYNESRVIAELSKVSDLSNA